MSEWLNNFSLKWNRTCSVSWVIVWNPANSENHYNPSRGTGRQESTADKMIVKIFRRGSARCIGLLSAFVTILLCLYYISIGQPSNVPPKDFHAKRCVFFFYAYMCTYMKKAILPIAILLYSTKCYWSGKWWKKRV